MKLLNVTISLLCIMTAIDSCSIVSGYFRIAWLCLYWLADRNGPMGFFRENETLFNGQVESHRNMILTFVFFCASWSLASTLCGFHFRKRQFLSKGWPLTIWKFACFMCSMRLVIMTWSLVKFHFYLVFELVKTAELFDDTDRITVDILRELYGNGTIGAIPAILIGSLPLNTLIVILMAKVALDTLEWRTLNVSKRIDYFQ
jgi:magnesium-transporting ATPase (P-type)